MEIDWIDRLEGAFGADEKLLRGVGQLLVIKQVLVHELCEIRSILNP